MNARQQGILDRLFGGVHFRAAELASGIGAPVASIRRAIGSLREQGYPIRNSATGYFLTQDVPVSVDAYDTDIDSSDEDDLGDDKFYDDGGW